MNYTHEVQDKYCVFKIYQAFCWLNRHWLNQTHWNGIRAKEEDIACLQEWASWNLGPPLKTKSLSSRSFSMCSDIINRQERYLNMSFKRWSIGQNIRFIQNHRLHTIFPKILFSASTFKKYGCQLEWSDRVDFILMLGVDSFRKPFDWLCLINICICENLIKNMLMGLER